MPKNFFGHCKVRNWPKTFLHWAENNEFTFQQFKKICYCEKTVIRTLRFYALTNNSIMTINPLRANLTKWSNTLKKLVGCCWRIVWVCLTILWGWRFKERYILFKFQKRDFYQTSVNFHDTQKLSSVLQNFSNTFTCIIFTKPLFNPSRPAYFRSFIKIKINLNLK